MFADVIGPPLIEPGNVDAEIMLSAAEEYADRGGAPTNGPFAWVLVGLLMSLRTLALPFPLLRGFTMAPFARRLLISAGAATALTAVAWIYFR